MINNELHPIDQEAAHYWVPEWQDATDPVLVASQFFSRSVQAVNLCLGPNHPLFSEYKKSLGSTEAYVDSIRKLLPPPGSFHSCRNPVLNAVFQDLEIFYADLIAKLASELYQPSQYQDGHIQVQLFDQELSRKLKINVPSFLKAQDRPDRPKRPLISWLEPTLPNLRFVSMPSSSTTGLALKNKTAASSGLSLFKEAIAGLTLLDSETVETLHQLRYIFVTDIDANTFATFQSTADLGPSLIIGTKSAWFGDRSTKDADIWFLSQLTHEAKHVRDFCLFPTAIPLSITALEIRAFTVQITQAKRLGLDDQNLLNISQYLEPYITAVLGQPSQYLPHNLVAKLNMAKMNFDLLSSDQQSHLLTSLRLSAEK